MARSALHTLVLPLVLAMTAPALGQQGDRSREDRDQSRRRDQQRQEDGRQRARDQQSQQQRDGQGDRRSQRQEARTHYRAGLIAGYMLGYADGMDDYVLVVGTQGRSDRQSARQGQRDRGRRGGDQFRDQLRDRARQQMAGRARDQRQGDRTARQDTRQRQLSGEIVAVKRVRLQNDQQRHLVALIETQQGQRRIVDVGPTQQLQDLDLQKGDQITVRGSYLRTRGEGTPVLNARVVESQGQRIAIRGDGRQQDRQRMQR